MVIDMPRLPGVLAAGGTFAAGGRADHAFGVDVKTCALQFTISGRKGNAQCATRGLDSGPAAGVSRIRAAALT
jgi:hypothetical protein